MSIPTIGGPGYHIDFEEFEGFAHDAIAEIDISGKSVCLIIPDDTRACPMPQILSAVYNSVIGRAASVTCVIALGTHEYMEADEIALWTTGDPKADVHQIYPGMLIINHHWKDPDQLITVGHISADRISELSEGRLRVGSDVLINKTVAQSDVKIIVGPILPHEVAGISGGNKYFIPGCAARELIDLTHWVGALITSAKIIGTTGITPVRAMINEGSELIGGEKYCLAFVVRAHSNQLESASFGSPEDAWSEQAKVTAQTHITYIDEPFPNVISQIPLRYHDIWTAAKGVYKTEPAVAYGGEIVIYAPHISAVSEAHPEIYYIGYHCRDYYVHQWEKFKDIPWGVLAHSTHGRGAGSYDPATGIEDYRLKITFATAIPPEVCESINVGYRDPESIPELMSDPQFHVVEDAGEVLFRLASQRPGI